MADLVAKIQANPDTVKDRSFWDFNKLRMAYDAVQDNYRHRFPLIKKTPACFRNWFCDHGADIPGATEDAQQAFESSTMMQGLADRNEKAESSASAQDTGRAERLRNLQAERDELIQQQQQQPQQQQQQLQQQQPLANLGVTPATLASIQQFQAYQQQAQAQAIAAATQAAAQQSLQQQQQPHQAWEDSEAAHALLERLHALEEEVKLLDEKVTWLRDDRDMYREQASRAQAEQVQSSARFEAMIRSLEQKVDSIASSRGNTHGGNNNSNTNTNSYSTSANDDGGSRWGGPATPASSRKFQKAPDSGFRSSSSASAAVADTPSRRKELSFDDQPIRTANSPPLPSRRAAAAAAAAEPDPDDADNAFNRLEETPIGGGNGMEGISEFPDGGPDAGMDEPMLKCKMCERSFRKGALARHRKICKKVFLTKRKAFKVDVVDPNELRDIDTGATSGRRGRGRKKKEEKKAPKNNWRAKSDAFKAAMRAGRAMNKALAEGKDIRTLDLPDAPPAHDTRVPCPHCNRKFNQTAADRHIPRCNSRAR